ncbi:acyl-CoA dehydrogenase family protein [Bacillus methanolicus]|uniref:Acyl-CoA dehydrogenase n=1 Tax=Bacillus methanolicus (strain MGA3 / ATCC 53907) TaxID=796606 RepID=A0A068LMR9_BACMM|nr:acyl-CoA dehydrogenase family protein [Bacillus methanolicus]AIE58840.1 Putative acyl-CoA dehydrogenase [Bacillus methanolicus MGA3]
MAKERKQINLSEELTRPFIQNERQAKLFHEASVLADRFHTRAAEIDEEGRFPFENFRELKNSSYVSLTVPKKYGGEEISLYEFVLLQERIAQGDASTALCIGWHLGVLYDLRERQTWESAQFERICREVVQNKVLINRLATEIATGSPTRGGKPQTIAVKKNGKWIITGRKSFASMAVALDYSLVTATIEESGEVGSFLVDHRLKGVSVEENWDMLGMRGTRSDDLILDQVELPEDALVELDQLDNPNSKTSRAWLLHIPACYLGVAIAARNYAVSFAAEYQPNSLQSPIKDVPEVQRKIGEMDLELLKARNVLYSVARRWDTEPDKREGMAGELAAAKHIAVNSANVVVDLAMRIVGARSLQKSNPLQRFYRDVRTGIHNPPMDDAVISLLAKQALKNFN